MNLADVIAFLNNPEDFNIAYDGSRGVKFLRDDCVSDLENAQFFVAGFEFGPTHLIATMSYRGDGFDPAWIAWIDSLPTIDPSDNVEALRANARSESFLDIARDMMGPYPSPYGSDAAIAWEKDLRAKATALLTECESPVIGEGYEFNSSGGIVEVGHYAQMHKADLSKVEIEKVATNP